MSIKHVVSCSGGKDSTATYLLALERTGGDFLAVFADTGNEHPAVYEYLAELPRRTATKWWHEYAVKGDIHFIKGRIKFGDATAGAPFPSALVLFWPRP